MIGKIVRQVLQEEIAVLDLHRRADVDLHAEDAFQLAAFLVEVDHVHRRMAVDPVLMMVPLAPGRGNRATRRA